ncbi:hypothetical protein [uncultured Chryseobacterium sp.]|uniref:hypothetical protein n=1 Tax=uncultured Chryseobacterium sp. TaxID=259322 RepID=UPI0025D01A0E|nr:hypothetical protein [uncultured Chryseobacterium sp.]
MKSLELQLKKRLLIVEAGEIEEMINVEPGYDPQQLKDKKVMVVRSNMNFICSGSDLTEEIAEGMVQGMNVAGFCRTGIHFYNYCKKQFYNISAIDSFVSAIEACGHWWTNPQTEPLANILNLNGQQRCDFKNRMERYLHHVSRTFHPERTIICEIVE